MKTNFKFKTQSIAFAYVLLAVVFLIGCEKPQGEKTVDTNKGYNIKTIDSCEYIMWGSSYGFLNVTHKGNCKYCILRTKEQR